MVCVRKRGKSWNAQVRKYGWKIFTKTFKTKLDATKWIGGKKNLVFPTMQLLGHHSSKVFWYDC